MKRHTVKMTKSRPQSTAVTLAGVPLPVNSEVGVEPEVQAPTQEVEVMAEEANNFLGFFKIEKSNLDVKVVCGWGPL